LEGVKPGTLKTLSPKAKGNDNTASVIAGIRKRKGGTEA